MVKTETPAPKPDAPVAKTEAPAPKPDVPVVKTETPAPKPDAPVVKTETPAPKPDAPVAKTETPAPKPDAPVAKTETPAPKPDAPVAKTETPAPKPDVPVAKTEAPAPKPNAPVAKTEAPAPKPDAPVAKTEAPAPKPNAPVAKADAPAAKQPAQSWLVSEMPSPIDYRPLLTAVIHPTSSSEGGPSGLTIRCLGGQTGISIQTAGVWRAVRKNALAVDHQINDQSVVRQMWTLSTDAKTATYAGDPVALLRSLPEGTRLTINVSDGGNARHDATFLLAGWETVRNWIGTACKWPKADAQALSGH